MDKVAIKTFAIESRRKMIESVKYQASLLGIAADEIREPIVKAEGMETYDYGAGQYTIYDEDIKKRQSLVREINNKGFDNVMEEVAYTWFNRIIAIRFMEVNDYLPTRTRVLSSDTEGKAEPDIITEAFDLDLDYSDEDREKIFKLKDESKLDELFQFLFIKQCNKLNEILPGLFEKTEDYMELLLDISFTDEDSVIRQLVDTISEEEFGNQVEIIGWLYQYYISEIKDEVIIIYKSKPIPKKDIPAATQLFTPDWIVRYMVDNSLGRFWIERNPLSHLKECLEFYFIEAEQKNNITLELNDIRGEYIQIENLKFFDPCMGSGHILVYAFDVFFEIYKELGFQESDISELILKNNIFGLDIDKRAYQLSYFAIMMKAREYDRLIFKKNIIPNLFEFKESDNISINFINDLKSFNSDLSENVSYLIKIFGNSKEYGSLLKTKSLDWNKMEYQLYEFIKFNKNNLSNILYENIIIDEIFPLINQAKLLNMKYEIVVTNPPYMNKFDSNMKRFAKKYYEDYSKDLFSMFIYHNFDFCIEGGYSSLITPFSWMFLKSFENLRKYILNNKTISSLIQLEYNSFNEIAMVPVGVYIFKNSFFNKEYNGVYFKLSEFKGDLEVQRQKVLNAITNDVDYKFYSNSKYFENIPGSPISYYLNENIYKIFINSIPLKEIDAPVIGIASHNDSYFLKRWYEVDLNKVSFNSTAYFQEPLKWFPYNKGGLFRKWYGNNEFIINFENEGYELRRFKKAQVKNRQKYFVRGMTWSRISSSNFSVRYHSNGFIMGDAGPSAFAPDELFYYILGLLNSSISQYILSSINPTLNYQVGNISEIPIIIPKNKSLIEKIVLENINLCKNDWDDYETSWDFKQSPLLVHNLNNIKNSFEQWESSKNEMFNKLKENEIKLNKIFSDIYNVDDLKCFIDDNFVSIKLADYDSDIKSFISYAVGCMFGRYSLDEEGLQFAGGEFDINNYSKFVPDDDNIIPVLDTEYFNDDIVGRFVEFVKTCFGEETLEENLDFIAGALKKKGKTSREIIRNYFLTDFFKDHAQTYKKCPIYWQFDSGKQNAFKCLVYMHRYEPGLVARVRTDYLHKTQKAIEQNLAHCESTILNSSNKSEISKATKDKSKYIKQLDEIRGYDEALAHIANQQIEIDLDDGVKLNHAKFQDIEISKEGQKAKKINLLKKI